MSTPERGTARMPRSLKWRFVMLAFCSAIAAGNGLLLVFDPADKLSSAFLAVLFACFCVGELRRIREMKRTGERSPDDDLSWTKVAGDFLPYAAVGAAFAGFVDPYSGWSLLPAALAVLCAMEAAGVIRHHRRKAADLRAVLVGLVRDYDEANPDARRDALEYVPADVLAEARKAGEGDV